MKQNMKRQGRRTVTVLTVISLLFTSHGLPFKTVYVKADSATGISGIAEEKNINLNVKQEDGSFAIAGISDPGQPNNSQIAAKDAAQNNWGEEKDADGNVVKSGSYVHYGNYQQSSDPDGGYKTEPIKWRVLDADTQDFNAENDAESHTMFLMADKVLEWVNFNESQKDGGIYATSNLRKWLNSELFDGPYPAGGFRGTAFDGPEKKAIAVSSKPENDTVEIKTLIKDNSGLSQGGLEDRIFVLSAEEANGSSYGFYHQTGWGDSNTRKLTATDYAADKNICAPNAENKDWWLRSRVTDSSFSASIVDCTGWLWAGNVDGHYSSGDEVRVGVAPAFNLNLSSVSFTSASGTDKTSSFAMTSDSCSKEWNLTVAGGSGFMASRKSSESGAVRPGGEVAVDITDAGTAGDGVEYTQISAMLIDKKNTAAAYGKVADADASRIVVAIPAGIPYGEYTLNIFAEDVNSAPGRNLTDYASNMAGIPITVGDTYDVSITNPAGSHITYAAEGANGAERQGVLKAGGSYTPVVYTADSGYYFPKNYSVPEVNGIMVTRNSFSQITVSGNTAGDAVIVLPAAAAKESLPAPEGIGEAEGQITGTDTAMEYRIKPADGDSTEWADCADDVTRVEPGTYEVRYKETDTNAAGKTVEITVLARYTVTITNPENSGIIRSEAAGNGEIQQKVKDGEAITEVEYTAGDGYYFPDDYHTAGQNGIVVTRKNDSRITVSGIPTANAAITLQAAAKKQKPVPIPTANPIPVPIWSAVPTSVPAVSTSPTVPGASASPTAVPMVSASPTQMPTSSVEPSVTPKPTAAVPSSRPEKKLTVLWWKVPGTDGFDVFGERCGKELNSKSLIKSIKGRTIPDSMTGIAGSLLDGSKSYKIKIKAYKLIKGRKVYLASSQTFHIAGKKNKTFTNAKKVKVSPKSVILKSGKSSRIEAEVVKQSKKKKLLSKSHGLSLRFLSTDTEIATVTAKGKIKAKKKGTCYIYITALNGVRARVKVTVK